MRAASTNIIPEQMASEVGAALFRALQDPKQWAAIPMLNYTPLHELKDLSVVRFRGMIQDMQDPEMYLQRYEVVKGESGETRMQEGKYRDCLVLQNGEQVNHYAQANVQSERRTLFVVTLPGMNDWCHEYESQCNRASSPRSTAQGASPAGEGCKKRSAPEQKQTSDMDVDAHGMVDDNNIVQGNTNKRQRTTEPQTNRDNETPPSSSHSVIGVEYHLNSPIPERPSKACMIKIYSDFEKYKLNTLIDVVGFLSVNPALDASTMDVDNCEAFENVNELQAQNPPPSLIPRLHAIYVQCLPHPNPLLDERLLPVQQTTATGEFDMRSVGNELRNLLKLCLFNDELAAEYLLSHLISAVYCRADARSLGKFVLNLFNLPRQQVPGYSKQLYEIMGLLVPASHYITMDANTLNSSTFTPKKDYETNKLVSGVLQLAPQTHLVIDESIVKAEPIREHGMACMQSLGHLMLRQQLKCNFQYYEIDYDVDIPVLTLSEHKSVMPHDALIPVEVDEQSVSIIEESMKAARHYLNPTRLDQFRRFITKAKLCDFNVNPAESEMIQNDFVEMRKANTINGAEGLHQLLVLTRLLAVARGKAVLDKDSWELAKQLEATRDQRYRQVMTEKKQMVIN